MNTNVLSTTKSKIAADGVTREQLRQLSFERLVEQFLFVGRDAYVSWNQAMSSDVELQFVESEEFDFAVECIDAFFGGRGHAGTIDEDASRGGFAIHDDNAVFDAGNVDFFFVVQEDEHPLLVFGMSGLDAVRLVLGEGTVDVREVVSAVNQHFLQDRKGLFFEVVGGGRIDGEQCGHMKLVPFLPSLIPTCRFNFRFKTFRTNQ